MAILITGKKVAIFTHTHLYLRCISQHTPRVSSRVNVYIFLLHFIMFHVFFYFLYNFHLKNLILSKHSTSYSIYWGHNPSYDRNEVVGPSENPWRFTRPTICSEIF